MIYPKPWVLGCVHVIVIKPFTSRGALRCFIMFKLATQSNYSHISIFITKNSMKNIFQIVRKSSVHC